MAILEWDSHIDNKLYPYYTIKGIKHFTTMLIIPFRGVFILRRQEAGRSSLLAAICRHKVTEDEPLTPYDRITPICTGGNNIRE